MNSRFKIEMKATGATNYLISTLTISIFSYWKLILQQLGKTEIEKFITSYTLQ